MSGWNVANMTQDERDFAIEEQHVLLRELEARQSQPGYEVGTDARHELDLEILEGFNLLAALTDG